MYSSKLHGWKRDDWRTRCVGKAQTLTLFKSKKGNVSAGYLHIKWDKGSNKFIDIYGERKPDSSAFVLSIDHKMKLTPSSPTADVTYFNSNRGPFFGPWSLSVSDNNEYMNSDNNCIGYTGGGSDDCFNTPVDQHGYSILTGQSKGQYGDKDR